MSLNKTRLQFETEKKLKERKTLSEDLLLSLMKLHLFALLGFQFFKFWFFSSVLDDFSRCCSINVLWIGWVWIGRVREWWNDRTFCDIGSRHSVEVPCNVLRAWADDVRRSHNFWSNKDLRLGWCKSDDGKDEDCCLIETEKLLSNLFNHQLIKLTYLNMFSDFEVWFYCEMILKVLLFIQKPLSLSAPSLLYNFS